MLKHRDQGPYRHEDEQADQDHDDEGYEGATAHATALLRFVSIWRLILAAGRRCCQHSELVRVEYPALRRWRPVFDELGTEGVELLDLLGDEPHHRVGVGTQLQDSFDGSSDARLLHNPGRPRLLVEDATLVSRLPAIVYNQDHLRPRRHYPGHVLKLIHYPPSP